MYGNVMTPIPVQAKTYVSYPAESELTMESDKVILVVIGKFGSRQNSPTYMGIRAHRFGSDFS